MISTWGKHITKPLGKHITNHHTCVEGENQYHCVARAVGVWGSLGDSRFLAKGLFWTYSKCSMWWLPHQPSFVELISLNMNSKSHIVRYYESSFLTVQKKTQLFDKLCTEQSIGSSPPSTPTPTVSTTYGMVTPQRGSLQQWPWRVLSLWYENNCFHYVSDIIWAK